MARLEPLDLTDDEVTATLLALAAARSAGFGAAAPGLDAALEKLRALAPDAVRLRAAELEATLGGDTAVPVDPDVLETLAEAARENRRVRIRHARADGPPRDREVDPYAVVHADGRWYLAAFDHLRAAVRTFRVDRVDRADEVPEAATPPPEDFNPVAVVSAALVEGPRTHAVEVWIDADAARVRRAFDGADVEPGERRGVVLTGRTSDLGAFARVLASLGCGLEVRAPDALRDEVARLGALLSASALRGS